MLPLTLIPVSVDAPATFNVPATAVLPDLSTVNLPFVTVNESSVEAPAASVPAAAVLPAVSTLKVPPLPTRELENFPDPAPPEFRRLAPMTVRPPTLSAP